MRKINICLSLLALSFVVRAQPTISFNGGANIHCQFHAQDAATESWDEDFISSSSPYRVQSVKNDKFILGINAGVSINIPFTSLWAFRSGLDFNIKGGKAEGKYGSGNQTFPFSSEEIFMYIDIPLVVQYWLTKQFYLELGPDVGFLVSAKYKENDDGMLYESKDKSYYKKIELSISGGGGYLFGESGFGAFARYIHGLTKVDISEPYYSNVKNSTGQFGFFYRLKMKQKK